MTTMNVSLPAQMKDWVETRLNSGRYHNASEYVRDLIRKDQDENANTIGFIAAIELGRDSGIDPRSVKQILSDAKRNAKS